jgi:hypothetical protein
MISTKPNWETLKGVDAWSAELKLLLQQAREAAQAASAQPRLDVAAFLAGFIQESWPQTAEMDKLDALAQQTVNDLMLATIDERLGAIASRTTDFVKLAKELDGAAAGAESAAASIRLEGVKNLIDSTTQTIASAKALAASLDESVQDEKKIADLVERTVAAVERLRTGVAGLI